MKKFLLLAVSHAVFAVAGFAAGIYLLPILTAPPGPSAVALAAATEQAEFRGEFKRDLEGSDFLHWGEGKVLVGPKFITLQGRIAPGPDYKLYLSPEFVEKEGDFARLRSRMALVGDVKNFQNFMVPVPASIDPRSFNTVIVWCESFGEFITAASYR